MLLIGCNHNTAELAVREKLAIGPDSMESVLHSLLDAVGVEEATVLSTCNRTEICVVPRTSDGDTEAALRNWLAEWTGVAVAELTTCTYCHRDADAVAHLVAVAAGLDSMVLGEPQIFGQLKSAVASADTAGVLGPRLRRAFDHVFAAVKRIRTETAIGENPVSVAFAAVGLTRHIFARLDNCSALLIGAGETVELVAAHLRERGIGSVVIANRSLERAERLIKGPADRAVALGDVPRELAAADIVVSSTASQLPILGKGAVEQALRRRKNRPYLMIDLAVPRDIEPQVADLPDVYLYSVDDLSSIVEENTRAREDEADRARRWVDQARVEWLERSREHAALDVVKAWRGHSEQLMQAELNRALKQLDSGQSAEEVLRRFGRNLMRKLTHEPTVQMKAAAAKGDAEVLDHAARLLGVKAGDGDS